MKSWFLCCIFSGIALANQSTHLLVFGGGNLPDEGVKRLVELAGSNAPEKKPHILYVPWADEKEFIDRFKRFSTRINEEFPITVTHADTFEVVKKNIPQFIKDMGQYTGIYFGGGDQNDVMDIMNDHQDLYLAFKGLFENGIVFSGNSAGLAIMSKTMITGEGSMEEIGPNAIKTRGGMGFVSLAVLDQHYIRRNRVQRLLSVLMGAEERFGIGVDENTGVYIRDGFQGEVVGNSSIVFVDSAEVQGKFTVQILKSGQQFTLKARTEDMLAGVNDPKM